VNVRIQPLPTKGDGSHRSTTVKIIYISVLKVTDAHPNGGNRRPAPHRRHAGLRLPAAAATSTPIQVYGAWHCSNDACTWAAVRNMTDFDTANHWLIDRGDGRRCR
jgi:hypothetical protein